MLPEVAGGGGGRLTGLWWDDWRAGDRTRRLLDLGPVRRCCRCSSRGSPCLGLRERQGMRSRLRCDGCGLRNRCRLRPCSFARELGPLRRLERREQRGLLRDRGADVGAGRCSSVMEGADRLQVLLDGDRSLVQPLVGGGSQSQHVRLAGRHPCQQRLVLQVPAWGSWRRRPGRTGPSHRCGTARTRAGRPGPGRCRAAPAHGRPSPWPQPGCARPRSGRRWSGSASPEPSPPGCSRQPARRAPGRA